MTRKEVMAVIHDERQYQIHQKGWTFEHDRDHSPKEWVAIFTHELGCAADSALNNRDEKPWYRAVVKLAAVCVAALEASDDSRFPSGCYSRQIATCSMLTPDP